MGYKNPIDPTTGKPKRGRPRKVQPVDTIAGPQPQELAIPEAAQEVVEVEHLNPDEKFSTPLREQWRKRMKGTVMMDVPPDIKAKYPDGDFCFVRNAKETITDYRTRFGYEPVETTKPLPGQTDSTFQFGDTILMVRSKELTKIHREVERENLLERTMNVQPARPDERDEMREAGRHVAFLPDEEHRDDPDAPDFLQDRRSARDGEHARGTRPRFATGTRYVPGGIPS